jgi:hypothetical protein
MYGRTFCSPVSPGDLTRAAPPVPAPQWVWCVQGWLGYGTLDPFLNTGFIDFAGSGVIHAVRPARTPAARGGTQQPALAPAPRTRTMLLTQST